jgi:DNA-binding beta-propeller fold protein YncE
VTGVVVAPDLMPEAAQPGVDLPDAAQDVPPPPVQPIAEDAPPPDRRRRYLLLLLLLLLLTLLIGFAIWYFLFRQPIENVLPNIDLSKPPAYQTSTYGLSKPLGVAVSSDGSRIYVTQGSGDQATVMLDAAGNQLGVLAPPADVIQRVTQLYVAVNPKTGDVYATDRTAGAVFIYGADGTYKAIFDPGTASLSQPLAISFDGDGNMYVSDVGGDFQKVHVFGPDGAWLRDLGTAGQFAFPNGIGIDKNGNVYVSDSNNGRLVVFDKTGAQLGRLERGTADDELGMPRGVAVDGQGRVFVVDTVRQSVQLFRALQPDETTPAFQVRFGREGTVDGTFEFPNGVAVDGRGRIYITDWNNDRLQVWSY